MRKRHHYKRRTQDAYEIDVTTFLNLMVVLVPFLLITAVFSRLTIVELNLPSAAGGPTNDADNFRVEVIVREAGMEISNGSAIIATDPQGIITLFNPAAERMLGFQSRELVGISDPSAFHEHAEVVKRAAELDIPVVLGSATPSLESLHNALQGRYRHYHLAQRAGEAAGGSSAEERR